MEVEYTLDQWEWQGTTRSIDIDPEDYAGMSAQEIKDAVYTEIRRDADQNLHFVYAENDVAAEILETLDGDNPAERDADTR